jgi:hypothetical protein
VLDEGENELLFSKGYTVLHIGPQGSNSCCVWVLEEVARPGDDREIPVVAAVLRVYRSDDDIPMKSLFYLGTAVVQESKSLAFHVFMRK